jgi:uncharacterized membrane protein YozB (DUF420 family)
MAYECGRGLTVYTALLFLHSWLRWLVLVAGLVVIAKGFAGSRAGRAFTPGDRKAGLLFVVSLDVQFLIGLVLYFVASPITRAAFADFKGAMRDAILRFFPVEHTALALLAVAVAHIGNSRARRAGSDAARHRTLAIFFTIALLLLLAAIPWPGRTMGRPLFRM